MTEPQTILENLKRMIAEEAEAWERAGRPPRLVPEFDGELVVYRYDEKQWTEGKFGCDGGMLQANEPGRLSFMLDMALPQQMADHIDEREDAQFIVLEFSLDDILNDIIALNERGKDGPIDADDAMPWIAKLREMADTLERRISDTPPHISDKG